MAKFWLDDETTLAQNDGFPARDLRQIRRLVKRHRTAILAAWSEHCG